MDGDAPLNYFNYFTEVEDTFVRRRGAHMLVSPLDWALIESWKEMDIPLAVVLRGIERAFDAFDRQPRRHRKVNSIFYCQQSVEESFAEHRQSMVGAADGDDAAAAAQVVGGADDADSPFQRDRVEQYLERITVELAAARARAEGRATLAEALDRASTRLSEIRADAEAAQRLDAEALERDLSSIDALVMEAVKQSASPESVEEATAEAKTALKAHKKGMDKTFYLQTFENFVSRRLREAAGIPRLSLFFMD
jgi:hypothetical protein